MKASLLLLILVISVSGNTMTKTSEIFTRIMKDLSFVNLVPSSERLVLNAFASYMEGFPSLEKLGGSFLSELACYGCSAFSSVINHIPAQSTINLLVEIIVLVCTFEEEEEVCQGAIQEMTPFLLESLRSHYLSKSFLCGELVPVCDPSYVKLDSAYWINEVLKNKKNLTYPSPTHNSTYKILHFSDPHVDVEYLEGSNAFCDEPLCCNFHDHITPLPSKAAGYWGSDSNCDLPIRTLEGFAKFVQKNIKDIDFILWTGDNTAHDIWHQSRERNLNSSVVITNIIKSYLPNIPVLPIIGNHEPYPVNVYSFGNDDDKWLVEGLANIWKNWLGEEGYQSFVKNGFYSKYLQEKNLRIIGLHTQAGNNENWRLFADPSDPGSMLSWLTNELQYAEDNNQTVYILGHIPAASDLPEWSIRYKALIDRYSYVIRGQFFGHTHSEEFYLHKSFSDNSTVGVDLLPGSLTTYSNINPEFRVYEIDRETNLPINYYQYRLNLTKYNEIGNRTNELEFDLAYNFLEEYDLEDMSFKAFDLLHNQLKSDNTTLRKFLFNTYQGGSKAVKNSVNATIEKEGINVYCSRFDFVLENEECFYTKKGMPGVQDRVVRALTGRWRKNLINA